MRAGAWIHAVEPSREELVDLFAKLNLDSELIDDVQDFFEVPRVESSDGATFFFTRYPLSKSEEGIETAPLAIVFGETFILTIAQQPVSQFEPFLEGKVAIYTTQKTQFFLHIMWAIKESFERELVKLRRSVNKDRARLHHVGKREIERFVTYEHKLNDMISALIPTNMALQQVTKGNRLQMFDEDHELLEDLLIDNNQLIDSARSVFKTLQNIRSATEAILANNLNATIRTLTLVTVLLTIPMVVASFFGMNVKLPFAEVEWAFWAILAIVLAVVGAVVFYFKRNNWF
jgi:magnesium transporter